MTQGFVPTSIRTEPLTVTSRLSIKKKLAIMLVLLAVALVTLSVSGIRGIYNYRALARGVSLRSQELPLATEFATHVSNMRVAFSKAATQDQLPDQPTAAFVRDESLARFQDELDEAEKIIDEYRRLVVRNQKIEESDWRSDENKGEAALLHDIQFDLNSISNAQSLISQFEFEMLEGVEENLESLQRLSKDLPMHLQHRMANFKEDVQIEYRTAIVIAWATAVVAATLLLLLFRLLYSWLLKPIHILLQGSRLVASGNFDHRIHLSSKDEMAELASAMNRMTRSFQEIRDRLDEQVRERTKQVVRSEQLASVGFLAAGVAHEINNPLASIALCAESLEDRLHDIIQKDDSLSDDEHNAEISTCRDYLRMMQDEAFRCKGITGRLLDFARIGEVERQDADLREVIQAVVDMVGHLRTHKGKKVVCEMNEPVYGVINSQEIKQVILNLITNALDSLDGEGQVTIRLKPVGTQAQISVVDTGCGMNEETLKHLFEPFFTRRRDGSGTGLGMSISYRIVSDHGGEITAESDGPGKGSRVVVTLPLSSASIKELSYQQAA